MIHKNNIFKKAVEAPAVVFEKAVETSSSAKEYLGSKEPLKEVRSFWRILGPGLTAGASDDDPSGIATYSQAGAQYGSQLLWLSGFTFPLMAVIQEMCARIGLVTGRGLSANIRLRYPRWVLYTCTLFLFGANTLNIGADLGAMAQATQLIFPHQNFIFLVIVFGLCCLLLQIFSTYDRYARYLKYLALVLFTYVISTFLIKGLDWQGILFSTLIPSLSFSKEQIILVCAILGTTISPYLFFWQTSQEVEEEILGGKKTVRARGGATKEEIKDMRIDVWSGMFFSNLIMFFIMTASFATLFSHGIYHIGTAADAAEALHPFAGDAAYFLFTLGIIGTGLLAVPVLAGSASYAVTEAFHWKSGLYLKLKQAYAFYGVLIIAMCVGIALNFFGIDPIQALIYSAVANGLVAPIVLILIVSMSSNKKIMGKWANGAVIKTFGWVITVLMTLVAVVTIGMFFV